MAKNNTPADDGLVSDAFAKINTSLAAKALATAVAAKLDKPANPGSTQMVVVSSAGAVSTQAIPGATATASTDYAALITS